jgi:hypothetical protein
MEGFGSRSTSERSSTDLSLAARNSLVGDSSASNHNTHSENTASFPHNLGVAASSMTKIHDDNSGRYVSSRGRTIKKKETRDDDFYYTNRR